MLTLGMGGSPRQLCKWSTNSLSSLSNLCFDIQLPSKTGAFITFAEALHMKRCLTLLCDLWSIIQKRSFL